MSINEYLPEGWAWTTIGEIAETTSGGTPLRSYPEYYGGNIPWVKSGELKDSIITTTQEFLSEDGLSNSTAKLLAPGTTLVAMYGATVGRTGILGIQAATNQAICAIEPILGSFNTKLMMYWLQFQRQELIGRRSGGAQPNISQEIVRAFHFPLAPTNEQTRIIFAIEQQLTRLDSAVASLQSAKAKTKQLRASLLKAAAEGELTAAWRKMNSPDETGTDLLARILAEQRAHWEEEQLAKMRERGESLWNDEWKKAYREPQGPDMENLPELPEGWCWATVEQVGSVQLGRQRAPQHHKGPYMRPYLRVANVFEDRIDASDILSMNFTPEEFEIYSLRYGDILLNEGQSLELLGRPAMYRDEIPGACFQNTLIRFRCYPGLLPEYALIVFRSYMHTQKFQRIGKHTTNIAHLGAGRFAALEFPLPPLTEQAQIVAEAEAQLSELAKTEEAIEHSLRRAKQERQSILREAFVGRLVEQEPEDEPASELLLRIREERKKRDADEKERRKEARKLINASKPQIFKNDRERIYYTLSAVDAPLKPEEVFKQGGFKADEQPESVEAFQVALTHLEEAGAVLEERPDDSTVTLRAVEMPIEQVQALLDVATNEQEDAEDTAGTSESVQEKELEQEYKQLSFLDEANREP